MSSEATLLDFVSEWVGLVPHLRMRALKPIENRFADMAGARRAINLVRLQVLPSAVPIIAALPSSRMLPAGF